MRTFIMAEKTIDSEKEKKMTQILGVENELLDCILNEQKLIHETVKTRCWNELETSLAHMEAYSDAFVSVDTNREELAAGDKSIYFLPKVEPLFADVRTKLAKSKIENQALATYVHATQDFLNGVLEECVPQQRNTLYTNKGTIQKPVMQSIVVNRVF